MILLDALKCTLKSFFAQNIIKLDKLYQLLDKKSNINHNQKKNQEKNKKL